MEEHTRALNALRQTQVELHAKTDAQVHAGFGEMRTGLQALNRLLEGLSRQA